MRTAYSAFVVLLVVGAFPSVSFAQGAIPYTREGTSHVDPAEGSVPVATVTLPAEAIALDHPQMGHGFVVGAATLDLKDRQPVVVFKISNVAETAIPLSEVGFRSVRVNSRVEDGRLFVSCGVWSHLSQPDAGDKALQPRASITVSVPVPPMCPGRAETVGFLVYLESVKPSPTSALRRTEALLINAFVMLRQTQ
jgi:hypothetical protein